MFTEAKDDGGGSDNWPTGTISRAKSPFWISMKQEVVVTTGAIRRAKLQPNCHHEQTNIQFFYRPDALPVTNQQCQSTEGKDIMFAHLEYDTNFSYGRGATVIQNNMSAGLPIQRSAEVIRH